MITVQCCELPRYMNRALFRKVDVAGNNEVRFSELELAWEFLAEGCPDEISMVCFFFPDDFFFFALLAVS